MPRPSNSAARDLAISDTDSTADVVHSDTKVQSVVRVTKNAAPSSASTPDVVWKEYVSMDQFIYFISLREFMIREPSQQWGNKAQRDGLGLETLSKICNDHQSFQ
jgi:hypothetical protein